MTARTASITYPEALDQTLAFGWIDGIHKRLDDEAYTIRFTPRRFANLIAHSEKGARIDPMNPNR